MKCLSLTQPFASLIACGAKRIETRSWKTLYRGPLAIHAAKKFPPICRAICGAAEYREALKIRDEYDLPIGCIVAVCQLIDCVPTENVRICLKEDVQHRTEIHPQWLWIPYEETYFGDYDEGRFAWVLNDVRPLAESIPARGALGLWEFNDPRMEEFFQSVKSA